MAPRRFAHRSSGSRRATVWAFIAAADTSLSAAGGTLVTTSNAALLALRPFTIVRTYIEWQLRSDQAAAIEFQNMAIGMAVVSEEAATAGVGSIPTPVTEAGSDLWFLHGNQWGDESNLTDRTRSSTRGLIESKAMRRVEDGQTIVSVVELGILSGCVLSTVGRFLIKVS